MLSDDDFARDRYRFELPAEQIAQEPSPERGGSRLLDLRGEAAVDRRFAELASCLPPGAVLVVNDTKVLPARVFAHRPTGGACELLFVEPEATAEAPSGQVAWRCLAKARRPLRTGQTLSVGDVVLTIVRGRESDDATRGDATIVVAVPGDAESFLEAHGVMPVPPYIARDTARTVDRDSPPSSSASSSAHALDRDRYQTVYATHPGAVAAPTAGLHLTPALMASLESAGHAVARLTLHVGLGTFAPIRVDDVRDHRMHRERFCIPPETAALVASGRPIVAVGTTVLRALEAAATGDHQVHAGAGVAELFIYPGSGHRFRAVDHLITNFHLPESTLLMLVCAFAGTHRTLAAYRHAVAGGYRFYSYGDAMFATRKP